MRGRMGLRGECGGLWREGFHGEEVAGIYIYPPFKQEPKKKPKIPRFLGGVHLLSI